MLALSFAACHQKKMAETASVSPAATSAQAENKEVIEDAVVETGADITATGAMYTVDSMTVKDNILSVFVKYSGGCKEHSWDLISNGMYAKSMPPQLTVCLKHTNNGDACRELIMKEIKFNIAKLKYASSKTTVIKIGDKQVRYTVE